MFRLDLQISKLILIAVAKLFCCWTNRIFLDWTRFWEKSKRRLHGFSNDEICYGDFGWFDFRLGSYFFNVVKRHPPTAEQKSSGWKRDKNAWKRRLCNWSVLSGIPGVFVRRQLVYRSWLIQWRCSDSLPFQIVRPGFFLKCGRWHRTRRCLYVMEVSTSARFQSCALTKRFAQLFKISWSRHANSFILSKRFAVDLQARCRNCLPGRKFWVGTTEQKNTSSEQLLSLVKLIYLEQNRTKSWARKFVRISRRRLAFDATKCRKPSEQIVDFLGSKWKRICCLVRHFFRHRCRRRRFKLLLMASRMLLINCVV